MAARPSPPAMPVPAGDDAAPLAPLLAGVMHRISGASVRVQGLQRLSGGASMQSWVFEADGTRQVLRRAPSQALGSERPLRLEDEAALLGHARAAGVKAPEVVAVLQPGDGLGSGYVMRHVAGEVAPARILAAPPPGLIDQLARELARIHTMRPQPAWRVPACDAASSLAELRARFQVHGGDRPILALALRWCETNLPAPAAPCLVHGDFRMGNLIVDAQGLAAVLDWELAHWGDAHEDLAYACLTTWRFGHLDRPAFGCAELPHFFGAYEAASGRAVEPARFRYWLVHYTLWWALTCMQMADFWRRGADRNLERLVVGRRTSESELDLLLLLEEDAPAAERARRAEAAAPAVPEATGEPSAYEMLQGLREWVEHDVKPAATGRARFMAAVAMNALGMLMREAAHPPPAHDAALAQDLLAGRQSLATPGVLARLRHSALTRLANDVPTYAALQDARRRWSTPDDAI